MTGIIFGYRENPPPAVEKLSINVVEIEGYHFECNTIN
jgi:hypothetical protein